MMYTLYNIPYRVLYFPAGYLPQNLQICAFTGTSIIDSPKLNIWSSFSVCSAGPNFAMSKIPAFGPSDAQVGLHCLTFPRFQTLGITRAIQLQVKSKYSYWNLLVMMCSSGWPPPNHPSRPYKRQWTPSFKVEKLGGFWGYTCSRALILGIPLWLRRGSIQHVILLSFVKYHMLIYVIKIDRVW